MNYLKGVSSSIGTWAYSDLFLAMLLFIMHNCYYNLKIFFDSNQLIITFIIVCFGRGSIFPSNYWLLESISESYTIYNQAVNWLESYF